jgi:hypothetical protein
MGTPALKFGTTDAVKVGRDTIIAVVAVVLAILAEHIIPLIQEYEWLPAGTVAILVALISALRRYFKDTRPEG